MTERMSAKQFLSGDYSKQPVTGRSVSHARIIITDMPPSANGMRKSFLKDGKVVSAKSDEYAAWTKAAIAEITSQRAGRVDGPYTLSIAAQRHWRSKRARDIDNLIKPLSDLLVKAGIVEDDCLCEWVSARWSDDLQGHAVVITVEVVA